MSPCRWETREVDPCVIRFSQAECSARFRSGTSLAAAWRALIAGDLIVLSFLQIKVIASHGRLFSLDNRRLVLWRLMGIFCGLRRVPCLVLIGPRGARRRTLKASGKFTTTCHGSFIFIRHIAIIVGRSANKRGRFEKNNGASLMSFHASARDAFAGTLRAQCECAESRTLHILCIYARGPCCIILPSSLT